MLSRAIKSLLDQTFTDWMCEVHNDSPGDTFPGEYVASLNDGRFIIQDHTKNLGGTSSFNLAFAGCEEKYASILEDDNWWEPSFLEEMTALMEAKPDIDVAWSNMRVWIEGDNNSWINTGNTIWPEGKDHLFTWPQSQQALGAMHSTGAMMYRSINAVKYVIPAETLLDSVELVRERAFKHPIYLHSNVLANFSITAFTNRSGISWKWIVTQVMQLGSFVMAANDKEAAFSGTLSYYREKKSYAVVTFFLVNHFFVKENSLYKYFGARDWYVYIKWLMKTNFKLFAIKKHLKSQAAVYDFLLTNTRDRYNEIAGR